jgi:hypothetical protein
LESIVIHLHPDWLINPDADLRYLIPEKLIKMTDNALEIIDNGYEYDDENDDMFIFLLVSDSNKFLEFAKDCLGKEKILDNNILESCIIAREENDGKFEILYQFSDEVIFKTPPK